MPFENSDIGFLTFKFKTFVAQGCNKPNRLRLSNVIIELSAYRLFLGNIFQQEVFPLLNTAIATVGKGIFLAPNGRTELAALNGGDILHKLIKEYLWAVFSEQWQKGT